MTVDRRKFLTSAGGVAAISVAAPAIAQSMPEVRWRGHAALLYANWLNYYVYQVTPYDPGMIPSGSTHSDF